MIFLCFYNFLKLQKLFETVLHSGGTELGGERERDVVVPGLSTEQPGEGMEFLLCPPGNPCTVVSEADDVLFVSSLAS